MLAVTGDEVLYLGMDGPAKGFHDRLRAYAQQGRGSHRGSIGALNSHDAEDALIALYIEEWRDRPFANLRDGHRFAPSEARELLTRWLR